MALAENLNRAIVNGDLASVKKLVKEGAAMDFLLGMRGTALCAALSANQSDIARFLIEAGCGVNVEDYDKEPPIFLAISKKCFDVVHTLTKHPKCNLNKSDPLTNVSPLALAVKNNHQNVIQWFIEAGADLNVTDHADNTALHIALRDQNYQVMKMLVKGGCDLLKSDLHGKYPIHIIADEGDLKALKILLQNWVDDNDVVSTEFSLYPFSTPSDRDNVREVLNKTTRAGQSTSTPLHMAISNGHTLMSKYLLRYGATAKETDDNPAKSPLLTAISVYSSQIGQTDVTFISWLLQAGADPNACGKLSCASLYTYIESPVMLACRLNCVEVLEILLAHGAKLDIKNDDVGHISKRSLLSIAFSHSAIEIAQFLIHRCGVLDGQDLVTSSGSEQNLLISLSDVYHPEVEEFAKAIISKDNPGESVLLEALSDAVMKNNIHLALALLQHGVDVNQLNSDGYCAIHLCIKFANKDFLLKLLLSGSDINVLNSEGMSPLEMCLEYFDEDHIDMAYFLIEAGCVIPNKFQGFSEIDVDDSTTDSDSSNSSDSFVDDVDYPPAFTEDKHLQKIVTLLQKHPQSLLQRCLHVLRTHFAHNGLPFDSMKHLPLPTKLLDMLLLKTFQKSFRIS
jgi:ankyrin repeat protein